ncbi:claudin-11-like [Hippocampus comes]|uniref:Claudin 11a n=1 Tax=Hippocampus comes TaxID=109280 RepID=A0A3Q2XSZ7_HIPCM|nr:PREDICTED: claudin-11-like [Hippocampus comes]XP_019724291.1 PREDICTED: claudin-11-like [Hippocampus comes]
MAKFCGLLCGFALGLLGWLGILLATASNDWLVLCRHSQLATCRMFDIVRTRGPWAECSSSVSNGMQTCLPFQIFDLPVYAHVTRALMVTASIVGLVAAVMVAVSLPCIRLGSGAQTSKNKSAAAGGVLLLAAGFCGLLSTVWFFISENLNEQVMSFGFALYAGWVGAVLCLLAGVILTCCSSPTPASRPYQDNGRVYFSKTAAESAPSAAAPAAASASSKHTKSVHV